MARRAQEHANDPPKSADLSNIGSPTKQSDCQSKSTQPAGPSDDTGVREGAASRTECHGTTEVRSRS